MSLAFALCQALTVSSGAPLPEWIEVMPAGPALVGVDGRRWVMDDAQRFIAATLARANGKPIVVDFNHSTHVKAPKGEESPAAAWLDQFKVSETGAILGHVESWTPRGAEAVLAREYRFPSPAFPPGQGGRPEYLVSVGLVNDPNFRELAALNAAEGTQHMDFLKKLAKRFGLPETATEAEIEAALNSRDIALNSAQTAAANPPLDKFVPISLHTQTVTELNSTKQKLADFERKQLDAEVEAVVAEGEKLGKLVPGAHEQSLQLCRSAGVTTFKAYLEKLPSVVAESGLDGKRPPKVETNAAGDLTAEDRQVMERTGLTEEEYRKAKA